MPNSQRFSAPLHLGSPFAPPNAPEIGLWQDEVNLVEPTIAKALNKTEGLNPAVFPSVTNVPLEFKTMWGGFLWMFLFWISGALKW